MPTCAGATWPPTKTDLECLVHEALCQVCVRTKTVMESKVFSSESCSGDPLAWRDVGLNSSQATVFMAVLCGLICSKWPSHEPLIPEFTGALLFQYMTATALVDFLHRTLGSIVIAAAKAHLPSSALQVEPPANTCDNDRRFARGADGHEPVRRRTAFTHVVSLGTLCMTVNMMERCELRRWPGPFDWVFSSPSIVLHCLRDNFGSFLDRTAYVAAPAKKAGHARYSMMVGRPVIFNHHNPMIPSDYEFLSSCVECFRGLLVNADGQVAWKLDGDQKNGSGRVLFLLFNLERHGRLNDTEIEELFEQLCLQSRYPFELLVVKTITRTSDDPSCRCTKIHRQAAHGRFEIENEVRVYELHCQGTHDGFRFSDRADMELLRRLVLHGEADHNSVGAPPNRIFELKRGPPGNVLGFGVSSLRAKPGRNANDEMRKDPKTGGVESLAWPVVRKILRRLGMRDNIPVECVERSLHCNSEHDTISLDTVKCVYVAGGCRIWLADLTSARSCLSAFAHLPSSAEDQNVLLIPRIRLGDSTEGNSIRDPSPITLEVESVRLVELVRLPRGTDLLRLTVEAAGVAVKLPRIRHEYAAIIRCSTSSAEGAKSASHENDTMQTSAK